MQLCMQLPVEQLDEVMTLGQRFALDDDWPSVGHIKLSAPMAARAPAPPGCWNPTSTPADVVWL